MISINLNNNYRLKRREQPILSIGEVASLWPWLEVAQARFLKVGLAGPDYPEPTLEPELFAFCPRLEPEA